MPLCNCAGEAQTQPTWSVSAIDVNLTNVQALPSWNSLFIISIKEGRLHVGPYVKQNVIMSTRKQKTKTQISKHSLPNDLGE